jgi:hypothetical protein
LPLHRIGHLAMIEWPVAVSLYDSVEVVWFCHYCQPAPCDCIWKSEPARGSQKLYDFSQAELFSSTGFAAPAQQMALAGSTLGVSATFSVASGTRPGASRSAHPPANNPVHTSDRLLLAGSIFQISKLTLQFPNFLKTHHF